MSKSLKYLNSQPTQRKSEESGPIIGESDAQGPYFEERKVGEGSELVFN